MRLNQVIAIEDDARRVAAAATAVASRQFVTADIFAGVTKSYTPIQDDGEKLPTESVKVRVTVDEVLTEMRDRLSKMLDVVATKDYGNTRARADVVVGDVKLLEAAPTTYLLWLEKQLADWALVISRIPILDIAEDWTADPKSGLHHSRVIETVRSKKIPRVLEKSPATDRHPAQTEVWYEDARVGTWKRTLLSGAAEAQRVRQMLERIRILTDAVKRARQQANMVDVEEQAVSNPILKFIFEGS